MNVALTDGWVNDYYTHVLGQIRREHGRRWPIVLKDNDCV
jgi:hypothetical protein